MMIISKNNDKVRTRYSILSNMLVLIRIFLTCSEKLKAIFFNDVLNTKCISQFCHLDSLLYIFYFEIPSHNKTHLADLSHIYKTEDKNQLTNSAWQFCVLVLSTILNLDLFLLNKLLSCPSKCFSSQHFQHYIIYYFLLFEFI